MNAFYFNQRTGARILAVIALFSLVAGLVPMQAFANHDPFGGVPQTSVHFCHSTGNNGGFNSPNSSITATGGQVNVPNGHAGDAHSLDIIPPFHFAGGSYPGQNWSPVTQDIWNNGDCNGDGVLPKSINLGITKVANDTTPDIGQSVAYTITVSNTGPDTASNVVVTDNVPAGTTFVSAVPVQTGTGPYTWNLGTIANGASKVVTVNVTVNSGTGGNTIINTASVAATEKDSNTQNNSITEDVTVNVPTPTPCTAPYTGNEPDCVPPPCPQGQTGTYPNCVTPPTPCPSPYTGNVPNCTPPPCPTGTTGIYPVCTPIPPPPVCNDQIDNDDDGLVDFPTDPGCDSAIDGDETDTPPPPTPCPSPYTGNVPNCTPPPCPTGTTGIYPVCTPIPPPPVCNDNVDNDGDGKIDFPADPGCSSATDTDETDVPPPPTYVCNDQIDNDGDGLVDFPADLGCSSATDGDESNGGGSGPDPIYGCTDETATNYNPRATNDDESCDFNYQSQCLTTPANLLTNGSFEADQGLTNGNWGIFTSVLGWASANVNSDGLEIWRGLITPSDGAQNAELDGNVPTTISQTVATIPGATYELRFDFAARANTGGASNNAVKAIVDTNTVVNQSTANTNWTTYGSTFVADASTDISIADMGTPADSYGTLLDNAVLCLVRVPVVDFCPNITGNQPVDSYVKDKNGQCYTPIDSCSVTVVSDTTNLEGGFAALLVTPHTDWLPIITDSLAKWIWGSSVDTPISGTVDETQTFTKTFVWSGTPATAILKIASDNGYSVKLNGTVVGSDAGEYNYSSSDTIINLTDDLIQGVNTLEISVTNKANGATSLNIETGNPAGLLYDLTITNTTGDCAPDGGGDNDDELSCSITASENSIRRGRDVTITWSSVDAAYVTIPNLGDELGTSGSQLVENLGEDTTYTMTVFGDVIGNTDTREQATCSVTVDTRSGGGGGGGNRVDRTPDGDVLGASDDKKPTGEVLGAQTDAIPTGAPNTGKGGSSTEVFGQFLATPRRRNHA